jgi:hypothetical protein
MKNIFNHIKTSGIGTMSGMSCYAGGQYLNSTIPDSLWRTIALFGFMTLVGVTSKLIVDKVAKKS